MTDDTKTMDLPLPLRTRNALEKHGLTTWREVNEVEDLRAIPGLGQKGADAILELMRAETLFEAPAQVTELPTPEESIARANGGRHTVASMIDAAMRGGLESLGKRAVVEEIQQRTEAFRARGGTIETGVGLLALRLESDLQARIGALIPTIKGLPHVKELGVDVDEKVVARMALIRGLESLEKTNGQPVAVKPTKAEPRQEDAPVVPTMQDGERYATPDGWNKQPPGEAVPASQVDVHSYYAAYGWERYWGKVDSTTFYFYWCPEKLNQDVAPFPNGDKGGRKITVQQTPWGPGHILPAGWNT